MTQKWLIALAAVIVIGGGLWWVVSRPPAAPAPAGEEVTGNLNATTTASTTPAQSQPISNTPTAPYSFSLVTGDTVVSWSFAGAYSNDVQLQQKAQAEITRLQGLFGSKDSSSYELYVSIANQYDLLGNGAQEFAYLNKALNLDHTHTGLAWANMGELLERLGAYNSARIAFEQAYKAEPIAQYQQTLSAFNQAHPAK